MAFLEGKSVFIKFMNDNLSSSRYLVHIMSCPSFPQTVSRHPKGSACSDKYLYELSLTPLPSLGGSCDFLSHPLFPLSEQFAASGFVLKSFLKGRPKNGFKMGNRRRKRRRRVADWRAKARVRESQIRIYWTMNQLQQFCN